MNALLALNTMFTAFGLALTETQKATLEKAKDIDLPDELDDVFDYIANDGAIQVKQAIRKSVHDSSDKALKEVADAFNDDEIRELLKLQGTPTKIKKVGEKILEKYKALEGSNSSADSKKLLKEISDLNEKLRVATEKEAEYEPLKKKADKADKLEKAHVENQIFTRLFTHKGISDERKSDRRFKNLGLLEAEDILAAKGLKVDPETLKIVKIETDQPFLVKSKEYTLDSLADEISELDDWKKKSNPASKSTLPIDVDGELDEATLAAAKGIA